jgi:hypothetical protein
MRICLQRREFIAGLGGAAASTSQQLALRARLILHAADNIGVRESARELDVWPKTVRYWRGRWRQAPAAQSVSERLAEPHKNKDLAELQTVPPSRLRQVRGAQVFSHTTSAHCPKPVGAAR